ncbi:hypothetical protein HDU93_006398 [Gonapodya sp. JEL0774]|nr:hypothetical protein HDU93_006398 [Gonapodya sp. JEL0774]
MYNSFVTSHPARQRYWARSFYGYPRVELARPNATHGYLARLFEMGHLMRGVQVSVPNSKPVGGDTIVEAPAFITQNVDSLQQRAGAPYESVLELHGNLRSVSCVSCHHTVDRANFQKTLGELNPDWPPAEPAPADTSDRGRLLDGAQEAIMGAERGNSAKSAGTFPPVRFSAGRFPSNPLPPPANDGRDVFGAVPTSAPVVPSSQPAVNPDGDTDLVVDFSSWRYPECEKCGGVMKPNVVFFGSRLLILGTSLAVHSALRLAKAASEGGKKVAVVNLGGTRGDELEGVERWEGGLAEVVGGAVKALGG